MVAPLSVLRQGDFTIIRLDANPMIGISYPNKMKTTPQPQHGSEYVSVNKNYLTIRENAFGYTIIPTSRIDIAVVKGKYIHLSLTNGDVFKCRIATSAAIDRISLNAETTGNSNTAKLFSNTSCESITGKKVMYMRTEQFILSGGLFLLAFFLPCIVGHFTADTERCLSLSSSLIFLSINFALYYLLASAFSITKKQESINYFRHNSKWLHLQSDSGIYYSIRKDYIRAVYHLSCGKYVLLKNNNCLPCSDDFVSAELATMEIKRERKWLRWVLLVLYIPLSVILTVLYLLILF